MFHSCNKREWQLFYRDNSIDVNDNRIVEKDKIK